MPPVYETVVKGAGGAITGHCPAGRVRWHAKRHLYLCGYHYEEETS